MAAKIILIQKEIHMVTFWYEFMWHTVVLPQPVLAVSHKCRAPIWSAQPTNGNATLTTYIIRWRRTRKMFWRKQTGQELSWLLVWRALSLTATCLDRQTIIDKAVWRGWHGHGSLCEAATASCRIALVLWSGATRLRPFPGGIKY